MGSHSGVGAGTEVDYVKVHECRRQCQFFGSTVDIGHLVVTGVGDDNSWTDGWQGSAQYVVLRRRDNGDNGIEADNNAENNDAAPRSNPTLANVIISITMHPISACRFARPAATILNTTVIGFNESCLDIDHDATGTNR